jgi:transposase
MNKKSGTSKDAADKLVRGIKRKTRKQYSAEEKIRIVLAGLRGEESIAALCRREGIAESLYYSWSKEFLEAGKKRLAGDTEMALSVLAYNLTRVMNILGIRPLIAAIKARARALSAENCRNFRSRRPLGAHSAATTADTAEICKIPARTRKKISEQRQHQPQPTAATRFRTTKTQNGHRVSPILRRLRERQGRSFRNSFPNSRLSRSRGIFHCRWIAYIRGHPSFRSNSPAAGCSHGGGRVAQARRESSRQQDRS